MKINFLTIGDENQPSSRYRGYDFARELNKQGFECNVWSKNQFEIKNKLEILKFPEFVFKRIFDISKTDKEDLFYIQKSTSFFLILPFIYMKLLKRKVIYDFDDAIFFYCPKRCSLIIKNSNLVITGNEYLADYAKRYNKKDKIYNGDIKENWKFNEKNKIIIGWIGSKSNLIFLEEIRPLLERLASKYPLELRIIGPKDSRKYLENFKNLKIKVIPWKLKTEWKELSEIDIGIMPLPNIWWTEGKCGLKLLQYMALKIPSIGSSIGVNKEIIQNGKNGFLASNEKDWTNYLEKLIQNPKLREKLGKAGRKTVEKDYSLEKNAKKLAEIIKSISN